MVQVENFRRHIMSLATDDVQRSEILGIAPRTLQLWRVGRLPSNLQKLMKQPQLLRALADDADALQTPTAETPDVAESAVQEC